MTTKNESSNVHNTVQCFNQDCKEEIPIAIWEDNVLSSKLVIHCKECSEQNPEFNLWDATAIETDSAPYANTEQTTHPIPDGEDYAVVDKHRNWEEEVIERFSDFGDTKEEIRDSVGMKFSKDIFKQPEKLYIEIFIRDPEDTEILEKAREEAREWLAETDLLTPNY